MNDNYGYSWFDENLEEDNKDLNRSNWIIRAIIYQQFYWILKNDKHVFDGNLK